MTARPDHVLLRAVTRTASATYTLNDWNQAVAANFGPLIRRKSLLRRQREILRTELINLARVSSSPLHIRLLKFILRRYRRAIRTAPSESISFLIECFADVVIADERWLTLSLTHRPIGRAFSLRERVANVFGVFESLLEGCYKPHLRILHGFASKLQTGAFPSNILLRDFGQLADHVLHTYSKGARVLLEDPEHAIPVNQWRNIGAHKTFAVKTRRTLELRYGHARQTVRRISLASLRRTAQWGQQVTATARMASTIIYLEYMKELREAGLDDPPLRLESRLVGLCHNLSLVGFQAVTYGGERDCFVLTLRDTRSREPVDALIHASQALDQLSMGIENDSVLHTHYKRVAVRLVSKVSKLLGQATLQVADGIAYVGGTLSQRDLVARTEFRFSDPKRVARVLANRRSASVSVPQRQRPS